MNRILSGLAMATALCSFQVAAAGDYEYAYTGLSGGIAELSDLCTNLPADCDDNALAYRLYSGARLLPNFGVEIGYTLMDDFGINGYSVEPEGLDVTTLYHIPMGSRLDLFAKAGGFFWDTAVDTNEATLNNNANLSQNDVDELISRDGVASGVDLRTGLGLRFGITSWMSLRADYDFIPDFGNKDIGGTDDLHIVSGAVEFNF